MNHRTKKQQNIIPPKEGKPKIVTKNYHVTSQTAYHITQLALESHTSEGRIIDKIMRSYLCDRASKYRNRGYYD